VIRHGAAEGYRAVPLCQVASIAIRVRSGEAVIIVDVAQCAGPGRMGALQRPTRSAVIELPICPQQRVVAHRALRDREA
jgi:hypothetical protein